MIYPFSFLTGFTFIHNLFYNYIKYKYEKIIDLVFMFNALQFKITVQLIVKILKHHISYFKAELSIILTKKGKEKNDEISSSEF